MDFIWIVYHCLSTKCKSEAFAYTFHWRQYLIWLQRDKSSLEWRWEETKGLNLYRMNETTDAPVSTQGGAATIILLIVFHHCPSLKPMPSWTTASEPSWTQFRCIEQFLTLSSSGIGCLFVFSRVPPPTLSHFTYQSLSIAQGCPRHGRLEEPTGK